MSTTLLEKMLAQMPPGPGNAQPQGRTVAAAGVGAGSGPAQGPTPDSGPTRGISALGGRFQRWHVEPTKEQEEEGWLIAYLDVVTLLLAMMVVMLAFSEPVSEAFRGERREIALDKHHPPVQAAAEMGTTIVPPIELPHPATAPQRVDGDPLDARAAPPPPALNLGDGGENVEIVTDALGVTRFRISSEVLFRPGQASLTPAGQRAIDALLPVLNQALAHTIVVEGHTDNLPIATERFPSNWELAASRAGAVVRHLEARGVNPMRLRAMGVADIRPLASNDTPAGRAQNRRVEIALEAPPPPR